MCDRRKNIKLWYFVYTVSKEYRVMLCADCLVSSLEHVFASPKIGTKAFFIVHRLSGQRRKYFQSIK